MNVQIEKTEAGWVVPCRRWVAQELGRNIQYCYQTKGNAVRAVVNPRYNLTTVLCYNLREQSRSLENILAHLAKHHVRGLVGGGDVAADDDSAAGGIDSPSV